MSKPAEVRPEADVEGTPLPEAGVGPVAEVVAEAPVEAAPPPPVATPFAPSPPSSARKRPRPASDAPIWLAAAFVSLLWGLAPIAFAVGYQQGKAPFDYEPFVLLVLGGMALGPAGLVWVAARLWVEARRLRGESQRAARLADEMVAPAVAAGIRAGEIATGLEAEIARAGQTANLASRKLEDLRAALEAESGRLDAAARLAGGSAETLATGLGRERERLEGLASGLDARTTAVSDAIARQARLVGEVSDLAETQLREAEASLTARSTDFTEAAGRLKSTREGKLVFSPLDQVEGWFVYFPSALPSLEDAAKFPRSMLRDDETPVAFKARRSTVDGRAVHWGRREDVTL